MVEAVDMVMSTTDERLRRHIATGIDGKIDEEVGVGGKHHCAGSANLMLIAYQSGY